MSTRKVSFLKTAYSEKKDENVSFFEKCKKVEKSNFEERVF